MHLEFDHSLRYLLMSNDKECSRVNVLNLPDDLLLNCLARVSRLYYGTLSLVSKRFRSLITSLELYEVRTILGRTDNCLYLCLSSSSVSESEYKPRWFTLCQRPTRIPNPNPKPNSRWLTPCFKPHKILEKRSSDNLMVSVQTHNFYPEFAWSRIAIGSNIYMIGMHIDYPLSFRVFFMDCRSHTWHEAPSPSMPMTYPLVSVLDGKIYVVGRARKKPGSSILIESFDPKTQMWEHVPSPGAEILGEWSIFNIIAINEKLYLFGTDSRMVYKPKENKWDAVEELENPLSFRSFLCSCVIDNVMYSTYRRKLEWYDSEECWWRVLKGLEELPKLPKRGVRLVDYGGKIAVLWEKKVRAIVGCSNKKMIWCAVIAVERRNGQEVHGKIEWCDVVLTVPKSCYVLHFLAVTV